MVFCYGLYLLQREITWWSMRDTLICGYIQNVVRGYTGLLKWWFTSLSLDRWLGFQDHAWSPSCWTGLKSSYKAVGYCQCLCTTPVTLVPISLIPAKVQEVPQTKTSEHLVPGTNNGMAADYKGGDPEAKSIFDYMTTCRSTSILRVGNSCSRQKKP